MASTRRQRILGVTCAVVAAASLLDHFTGTGSPRAAAGAQPAADAVASPFSDSTEIDHLIHALQARPEHALPFVHRDLFDPSSLATAVVASGAAGMARSESPQGDEQPPKPPQPVVLTLTAILDGRVPMAVINNRVVTCGAMVGEFRVSRIDRDGVTLRGPSEVRRLVLAKPDIEGASDQVTRPPAEP